MYFYCGYMYKLIVADILKFCLAVQKRALDEIVDRDVEKGVLSISLSLSLSLSPPLLSLSLSLPLSLSVSPPSLAPPLTFFSLITNVTPIELNSDAGIINWSPELVEELGSRLYPLWNRTAGDCLLDSVLQATWGVMDRDSTLRRAMADTLSDAAQKLVPFLSVCL